MCSGFFRGRRAALASKRTVSSLVFGCGWGDTLAMGFRQPAQLVLVATLAVGTVFADVDFDRDVRPILAEKCLVCHGPDDAQGGLRLTSLDEASRELSSGGIAIVAGDPDASEAIVRILHDDPDEVMPPPDKAESLTAEEKEILREWIVAGADWPGHWAYEPLDVSGPEGLDREIGDTAVRNPIDSFVLRRLDEEGIVPSPPASPEKLFRRLRIDLTGLAPGEAELADFLAVWKTDPDAAYAEAVDRLLGEKSFGERWGRHWLDRARYADSDGYEKDRNRPNAWRYRDWVIDAINRDMPFDEFTERQFAGDLLPGANTDDRLATAFNRQTLTNTEGGTDKEQWRVAAVMDRTETMGTVWLGLTLSCARCHTHKYDSITQEEYFRLYAYFNNGDETETLVPRSAEALAVWEKGVKRHRERVTEMEKTVTAIERMVVEQLPAWENRVREQLQAAGGEQAFVSLPVKKASAPKKVALRMREDGTIHVTGDNPEAATYVLEGVLAPGAYTGLQLDVLCELAPGETGPGRSDHGNFVLNRITMRIGDEDVVFGGAGASHAQKGFPAAAALDDNAKAGREGTGWAVAPRQGENHSAGFGFAEPAVIEEETPYRLELIQNYGTRHTIGRFRVRAMTRPTEWLVPAEVRSVLEGAGEDRTGEEMRVVLSHFFSVHPETRKARSALDTLREAVPPRPDMKVRVLSERTHEPRTTHILHRGEFKEPRDEVTAGTLAVLPPVEHRGERGDRLDLARWLVSGENPLPPRVVANQVWAYLFGEGLVATVNDFGVRGERPSHPDLLDWLAAEFVRSGWSRKELIRTIVLSSTYRQSSTHRPELESIDPKNRLLARQNRFRVEAETVRDLSLSVAGLLSGRVGGPSVFPPMPDGVADVNYNSAFAWKTSSGSDRYRRGLYTFFKRTAPHPNLMTFDCPDSNVTCVQRTRSNTPLAALITLNNEVFHEAAVGLAVRVLRSSESGGDRERLEEAFVWAMAREARAGEIDPLVDLLRASRNHYDSHPGDAALLLEGLPAASKVEAGPIELASWTATTRVLLNLDEFLTRE